MLCIAIYTAHAQCICDIVVVSIPSSVGIIIIIIQFMRQKIGKVCTANISEWLIDILLVSLQSPEQVHS